MKISITVAVLFLAWLAGPCFAQADGIPTINECRAVTIRTSQGWWLTIEPDGSGRYGFGALPAWVRVRERSFDFRQIYQATKQAIAGQRMNAEESYVAVTYFGAGDRSGREYYLLDQAQVPVWFRTARENTEKPKNELEVRSYRMIDDFWEKDPPVSPVLPEADSGT